MPFPSRILLLPFQKIRIRHVALHDLVLVFLLVLELAPSSTASRAELAAALDNADPGTSRTGDWFDDPQCLGGAVVGVFFLEETIIVQNEHQKAIV